MPDRRPALTCPALHYSAYSNWSLATCPFISSSKIIFLYSVIYCCYCRAGFEEERIEALLHSIELGLKHETAHFGLKLSMVRKAHKNIIVFFFTTTSEEGLRQDLETGCQQLANVKFFWGV